MIAHANLDGIAHTCWQLPVPTIASEGSRNAGSRNAPARCTAGGITCVVCVAVDCVVFLSRPLQSSNVEACARGNRAMHALVHAHTCTHLATHHHTHLSVRAHTQMHARVRAHTHTQVDTFVGSNEDRK